MLRPGAPPPAPPPAAPDFHGLLLAELPRLRQQAVALCRHRADADDLVQQAVANALAARDSFAPGTNFRAWMSRILRNRFISNRRRAREAVDLDDAPEAALSLAAGQEGAVAMAELRRCLARLPAETRAALVMISVQGLSYEEAAEALGGVPVGTLKCRVFRARRQLRAWLVGEEPEPYRSPADLARRGRGATVGGRAAAAP